MTMRPDQELKDAMTHVQYEFNRLVGTAMYLSGYLNVHIGPAAKAGPVSNEWTAMFCTMLYDAVLESFLIHARNLIDFFIGPTSPRRDDIVATDFFRQASLWAPRADRAALNQLRSRIAKRNAHLTYRLLEDKQPWNPRHIVDGLCDLRDQFNASAPAYVIATDIDSLHDEPTKPKSAASRSPT